MILNPELKWCGKESVVCIFKAIFRNWHGDSEVNYDNIQCTGRDTKALPSEEDPKTLIQNYLIGNGLCCPLFYSVVSRGEVIWGRILLHVDKCTTRT